MLYGGGAINCFQRDMSITWGATSVVFGGDAARGNSTATPAHTTRLSLSKPGICDIFNLRLHPFRRMAFERSAMISMSGGRPDRYIVADSCHDDGTTAGGSG